MVDDVRDILETAESKASQEVLDRARLARERREAEQRKRLDELRAHAAAAQAQREKRDDDRRRRQAEQRARDDDRRIQVEERKRAIWEASISRREALLQRERDRTERLERQRANRSAPRPAFAFGSSTPRLLEPLDSAGFFWAARRAASTTNVMFASAPLTRRASALQLDVSDSENKDEADRQMAPIMWSSVARRRTDLVPTMPAPRAPGRAYSMTRLDRLPHTPTTHHSRTQTRSGETTPGSRPGSALSAATGTGTPAGAAAGVIRRPGSAPRKPRPASIAGTGVNTPRGGVDSMPHSVASTPGVSRDATALLEAPRRTPAPAPAPVPTPRRPRPASLYANKTSTPIAPGDGKPPLHRKPKSSKEHEKTPRGKSLSVSPGRGRALSPAQPADLSQDKHVPHKPATSESSVDKMVVSAEAVTHKLEALQIQNGPEHADSEMKTNDTQESADTKQETKIETSEVKLDLPADTQKHEDKEQKKEKEQNEHKLVEQKKEEIKEDRRDDKKEPSQEKTDDSEMTASMSGRRITTEEQAKAALAERRRRAREQLERQAELERERLQREAEEEMERQRLEEERQRREEEEARELARLQRSMEEEKLRKAIEAQQQLEREEAERKSREEAERLVRLKEDEEKRKAAEEAERLRREEAEREEKERLARKQRVEAIMARTRLRKAEEDKKQQENKQNVENQSAPTDTAPNNTSSVPTLDNGSVAPDNGISAPSNGTSAVDNGSAAGNGIALDNGTAVDNGSKASDVLPPPDNGNVATEDLLGFNASQVVVPQHEQNTSSPPPPGAGEVPPTNNGNTADLLGLSQTQHTEDKIVEQHTKPIEITETNNGNDDTDSGAPPATASPNISANLTANLSANMSANLSANMSADFIQNEIATNESQKMADKLLEEDFTTHNGHGAHAHPLTLQNAI